eukprot:scaffold315682_cov21-Prasinocladus_malaysianus.AAC.2
MEHIVEYSIRRHIELDISAIGHAGEICAKNLRVSLDPPVPPASKGGRRPCLIKGEAASLTNRNTYSTRTIYRTRSRREKLTQVRLSGDEQIVGGRVRYEKHPLQMAAKLCTTASTYQALRIILTTRANAGQVARQLY